MNLHVSAKRALFMLSCLILTVAVACGGGTVTTWRAQTSYSPVSYSPPYKAMDPLESALGSPVILQAQWDDGTAIGCTAENIWAVSYSYGITVVLDTYPPETAFAIQYDGVTMIAECASGRYEIRQLLPSNQPPLLSPRVSILFVRSLSPK